MNLMLILQWFGIYFFTQAAYDDDSDDHQQRGPGCRAQ